MTCEINAAYARMLKGKSDTELLTYARMHISMDSHELIHELCDRIIEITKEPVLSKTTK